LLLKVDRLYICKPGIMPVKSFNDEHHYKYFHWFMDSKMLLI